MTSHIPRYPSGFNYGYRPASYFKDLDPHTLVVASILGEERRKDVEKRLASGTFDPLLCGDWLTESKLDDATLRLIGRVHPAFMGGEYLPPLEENEIEIARITVASVMQDVTSVRARRCGKRIGYRILNEHDGVFTAETQRSNRPLSLRELIGFINRSNEDGDSMANGLVFSILDWNLHSGKHPDDMHGFVSVSSYFYPELADFYDTAIEDFLKSYPLRNEVEEKAA
jgi:hypothetical protein